MTKPASGSQRSRRSSSATSNASSAAKSAASAKRRKLPVERHAEAAPKINPTAGAQRSALHQWSPAVNKAKAAAIDKKAESFACAKGAVSAQEEEKKSQRRGSPSPVKDSKADIIGELSKL